MSNDFWKDYEPEPTKPAPMTTERALDLALEALECFDYPAHDDDVNKIEAAITAIKQARSAPVQKPDHSDELTIAYMSGVHRGKELAAQRQWVGLTDDEIDDLYQGAGKNDLKRAREIEAKLKEKNT
jgi:hypothetical protein